MAFLLYSEQVSTLGEVELPDLFDTLLNLCERAGNFLNPLYSPILDKEGRAPTSDAKIITEAQDSEQEDVEMEVSSNIETQEPMQEDVEMKVFSNIETHEPMQEDVEMQVSSNIETQEPVQEDLSLNINHLTKQQESTPDEFPLLTSLEDFTTLWSSNEDDTTEKEWTLVREGNFGAESINTTQDEDFVLVEDEDFAEDGNM